MTIVERKAAYKTAKFISEDLSPYRGKVFRFVKDYNTKHKLFDIVTTYNGLISCKKHIDDKVWINIASSQDFIENGIPYDEFKDEFDELF